MPLVVSHKQSDGARRKVKRSPKSLQFILRETWMCAPNFIAIYPIVVEPFYSKPQMVVHEDQSGRPIDRLTLIS